MRLILKGVFVLLLCAVAVPLSATSTAPAILIVGDSLSAGFGIEVSDGWVALLQDRLTAEGYEYRVVNASISGDTTSGGLRRLPRALERHQPAITILELGGNDGLRATPVPIIRENLDQMVQLTRAAGSEVILAGMQIPPNYGAAYTEAFSAVYRDLAEETEIELIPFFMEGVALNPEKLLPDMIHPNEDGQPILLENAWQALKPLLIKGAQSMEAASALP
jgi:acyl-CoA thioesterase-1